MRFLEIMASVVIFVIIGICTMIYLLLPAIETLFWILFVPTVISVVYSVTSKTF